MKTAKRILAAVLCAVMLLFIIPTAFAAEKTDPIVVVSGMASFPLYDGDSGEQVFSPSAKAIMGVVGESILPMTKSLFTGDWDYFADKCFKKVYESLFEIVSCDEKGNSRHNIKAPFFPLSVDNYSEILENENDEDEQGVAKALAARFGGENVYYFNHDWRLDPLETADKLNAFIKNIKKEKNSEKVTLVPCSMGGVVTNSYIYKYGNADVSKIVYCLVASKGIDLVGELFSKKLDVNTDSLLERLFSFERGEIFTQTLVSLLQTGVEITPALSKAIDKFVASFLSKTNDRAYSDILSVSFASMPGMWSFCPDEYYETAKKEMFPSGADSAFLSRIDEYHYNVQNKAETLMKSAKENGTTVYVTAAYGYVGFPVTEKAWEQSDCLIETKNESFGATCALYGQNLGDDYKPVSTVCKDESHTHLSVDGIIDASSCLFPEQTWFIKYMKHVGFRFNTEASELLLWLVGSENEVSVDSKDGFPQFSEFNTNTGKLSSLTGKEIKHSILDGHSNFFSRIAEFFKNVGSIILKLYYKIKK